MSLNGLFGPLNPPIKEWRNQRVWLVGASSGICAALARDHRLPIERKAEA